MECVKLIHSFDVSTLTTLLDMFEQLGKMK